MKARLGWTVPVFIACIAFPAILVLVLLPASAGTTMAELVEPDPELAAMSISFLAAVWIFPMTVVIAVTLVAAPHAVVVILATTGMTLAFSWPLFRAVSFAVTDVNPGRDLWIDYLAYDLMFVGLALLVSAVVLAVLSRWRRRRRAREA